MLLNHTKEWPRWVYSLDFPDWCVSTHLVTIRYISNLTPEQEMLSLMLHLFYYRLPPAIAMFSLFFDHPIVKKWVDYYRKNTKFSIVRYLFLKWTFFLGVIPTKTAADFSQAIARQAIGKDGTLLRDRFRGTSPDIVFTIYPYLKMYSKRKRYFYTSHREKDEIRTRYSYLSALDYCVFHYPEMFPKQSELK